MSGYDQTDLEEFADSLNARAQTTLDFATPTTHVSARLAGLAGTQGQASEGNRDRTTIHRRLFHRTSNSGRIQVPGQSPTG
jgi:hypothetical protein